MSTESPLGLVADFGAAVAWDTQLFGRSARAFVTGDEVMWRFADVGMSAKSPLTGSGDR
jgi:hypothetical protein